MPASVGSQGAVGEPGATSVLQATNASTETMHAVVAVTAANLCPSHAAYASLLVDAEPRAHRVDLNDTREQLEAAVHPGEHAVLVVHLVDLHNGAMCIRLGETEFTLELIATD